MIFRNVNKKNFLYNFCVDAEHTNVYLEQGEEKSKTYFLLKAAIVPQSIVKEIT